MFIAIVLLFSVVEICSPVSETQRIQKRLTFDNLEKALDVFASTLKTVSIPDYSGKSGKWTYGVSNMKITSFDIPKLKLDWTQSSKTAKLTSDIGHVAMKGKWRFKYKSWWPLRYSDSGRFSLKFNNIHFSLAASIKSVNDDHNISVTYCRCKVNSSSLRLRGGGSWLYRLWNRRIEKKITKAVNNKVCVANCDKIKKKRIRL